MKICVKFFPIESNEWYTFIAEAVNELYEELENELQEKTPKEFFKSKRPSALIVTAKQKGNAQNSIISVDMWGQRERELDFFNDSEITKNNLD